MQNKLFTNKGLVFEEVLDHNSNQTFAEVINKYHSYMDYKDTCNRRINWLVYYEGKIVGAVGINSAILALGGRDKYIGWDKQTRIKNINRMANNYRFCLMPHNVRNLGSMVLKKLREVSKKRWKEKYGDDLLFLETLVKPPCSGAVYKADNWKYLGMTKGFSFSKAPMKLWEKEKSARGEMARNNPLEAIKKYAVGNKQYDVRKSEPKLIFIKEYAE